MDISHYCSALENVLPLDLPNRESLVEKESVHLALLASANERMNLRRIVSAKDGAVKHILDCVVPWKLFRTYPTVVDAGSGAGFPGLVLASVLPQTNFVLVESQHRRVDFLRTCIREMGLKNTTVHADRIESWLKHRSVPVVTARCFAPIARTVALLRPSVITGTRLLLYKGPDADAQLDATTQVRQGLRIKVVFRYGLAVGQSSRAIVEVTRETSPESGHASEAHLETRSRGPSI